MAGGREFEDFYAGGGVANPVQGAPFTGFGLTAAQKAALNAVPVIDADTSTEAERAEALEDVVAALKG
jgi:hypothetical protein